MRRISADTPGVLATGGGALTGLDREGRCPPAGTYRCPQDIVRRPVRTAALRMLSAVRYAAAPQDAVNWCTEFGRWIHFVILAELGETPARENLDSSTSDGSRLNRLERIDDCEHLRAQVLRLLV